MREIWLSSTPFTNVGCHWFALLVVSKILRTAFCSSGGNSDISKFVRNTFSSVPKSRSRSLIITDTSANAAAFFRNSCRKESPKREFFSKSVKNASKCSACNAERRTRSASFGRSSDDIHFLSWSNNALSCSWEGTNNRNRESSCLASLSSWSASSGIGIWDVIGECARTPCRARQARWRSILTLSLRALASLRGRPYFFPILRAADFRLKYTAAYQDLAIAR